MLEKLVLIFEYTGVFIPGVKHLTENLSYTGDRVSLSELEAAVEDVLDKTVEDLLFNLVVLLMVLMLDQKLNRSKRLFIVELCVLIYNVVHHIPAVSVLQDGVRVKSYFLLSLEEIFPLAFDGQRVKLVINQVLRDAGQILD